MGVSALSVPDFLLWGFLFYMKDPAILFYTADFLTGTFTMSDDQVGKYIRLLCIQHQKGHLTEKDMLNICKSYDEDIFSKFKKDEQGFYYNVRMDDEATKRKNYAQSRRDNRLSKKDVDEITEDIKNICESYDSHMETETITINENIIIDEKKEKKVNPKTEYLQKHPTLTFNDLTEELKDTEPHIYRIGKMLLEGCPDVMGMEFPLSFKQLSTLIKKYGAEPVETIIIAMQNKGLVYMKKLHNRYTYNTIIAWNRPKN